MTTTQTLAPYEVRQYVEQYRIAAAILRQHGEWKHPGTPYSFQTTILRVLDNHKLANVASLLVEEERLERVIQDTVRDTGKYPTEIVGSATKVDQKIHEAIAATRQG